MESPANIVKSNLTIGKILGFAVCALALFAILDVLGVTQWIIAPVSTARAKYAEMKAKKG